MSVLVKDMVMPEKCWGCPCFMDDGHVCNLDAECRDVYDDRPEWCPLVALPEKHGALIDRESMLKDFELAQKSAVIYGRECANAFYSSGNEISTEWWAVEDLVKNAVAVIEAEGKE